jgi:hypothetical protein
MRLFLKLIFLVAFVPSAYAVELSPHYPLTAAQARDASTLDETILSDKVLASQADPTRKIRWVRARFFSHDWKDGPWRGTVQVALPVAIAENRRGFAAMCPGGTSKKGREPGFDAKRDFVERTVLELGIPVAIIPSQGTHLGKTEIHEMSDAMTKRFVETGDPGWLAAWPGAALRARALTVIGKLAGHPIRSAVHMGTSISAGQGWVWAACDERVKGVIGTGSIGPFRKVYPERPLRKRLDFLSKAPDPVKELFVKHRDPSVFAARITVPALVVVGSNDFATPPSVLPEFVAAFRQTPHLVSVPNFGHGCGTRRHHNSFRMWIDHTLFGRPLISVTMEKIAVTDGRLACTATVSGEPTVKAVSLIYAASSNLDFLQSRYSRAGQKDNYSKAKWTVAPMQQRGGKWTVDIPLPSGTPPHIAACVDVEEEWLGRPGYASTVVRLAK